MRLWIASLKMLKLYYFQDPQFRGPKSTYRAEDDWAKKTWRKRVQEGNTKGYTEFRCLTDIWDMDDYWRQGQIKAQMNLSGS